MTQVQFFTALKLARAFGHEWALVISRLVNAVDETLGGNPEKISELTLAARTCYSLPGIAAPVMDGGDVVHVTQTRRLSWRIKPDGRVIFTISRPSGPVLRCVVSTDGEVAFERLNHEVALGFRHLMAAFEALKALLGAETAFAALYHERVPTEEAA